MPKTRRDCTFQWPVESSNFKSSAASPLTPSREIGVSAGDGTSKVPSPARPVNTGFVRGICEDDNLIFPAHPKIPHMR